MNKMFLILLISSLNSCASINSVSLTPIPVDRSRPIQAEVSKFIFLGFNFNNDFVDSLTDNLRQQCPKGLITGILTKDEVISYFLAHTRKVTAQGYCQVPGPSTGQRASMPGVSIGYVASNTKEVNEVQK